jgi:centrosomal protein CEP120
LFFRSKNHALDDEINRLKRSVTEWEKRYRDKEQEHFSFKEKQRSAPEVKLQAEINMLTLEKVHFSLFI